jgi:hypothetical protein
MLEKLILISKGSYTLNYIYITITIITIKKLVESNEN